jgi:uncharacterized membrane protein HdeD (DUF308 family)
MSTVLPHSIAGAVEGRLRGNWGWFLFLGILMILAGTFAISYPRLATFKVMLILGYLLLFGAGVEIASGIWAASWGGFFLHLLEGLFLLFLGVIIIQRPEEVAAWYTLFLAMYFVISGMMRAIYSIFHRFSGWGWMCFSGLITFALGIMIWQRWPEESYWVIGLFVGIDLIFIGWSWVMLGMALKSLPAGHTRTA